MLLPVHKQSKIHDRQNEQIMLCSSIAIIVIIFKHYVLNKNCVCLKEQHKHLTKIDSTFQNQRTKLVPILTIHHEHDLRCPSLHLSDSHLVQEKTESAGSETPDEADEKVEPMIPTSPGSSLWPHGKGGDFGFCNKVSPHLSTDQSCWWMATFLGWWNDHFTQVTVSDLQLHGIKRSNWITWYRDVFPVRVSVVCLVNKTWSFRWDHLR